MKKLLVILSFLFYAVVSFAQSRPIVQRSGPANTVQDAAWGAQYNAFMPRYADTTAANNQKGIDSCGAIIFTYDINNYWVRACSPKRWSRVGNEGIIVDVSGTAGRITSTGGISPVINIDPAYVGQTSITTLGIIATGTWNGTPIGASYGGVATGGSTGQVLTKNSSSDYDYSWATPSAGGGGLSGGNLGSNFRLYSPGSAGIYTVTSNATILLDSSLGTSIRIRADTTTNLSSKWYAHNQSLLDITNNVGNNADSVLFRVISNYGLPTKIWAFGDSFFQPPTGLNASTDSAIVDHWEAYLGLVADNYAVGGKGVWQMANYANSVLTTSNTGFTISNAGFNDLRRTDTTVALTYRKTLNKIINCYKSLFVSQYLSSATDASLATKYGAWSGYSASTVGGRMNGTYNTVLNDSIVYGPFIGRENAGASFIAGDSINEPYSRLRFICYSTTDGSVAKDTTFTLNNQYDGISDGSYNNRRGPLPYIVSGLDPAKSYKIKIINTQGTNILAVDFFFHLLGATSGYQMLWYGPAYMDATGYATVPAGASDWVMNEGQRVIDSLKTRLGSYPLYVANPNSVYIATTASGLSGDHIHPNDLGHRQYFQAGVNAAPVPIAIPRDRTVFSAGPNLYYQVNGVAQKLNGVVNAGWGIYDSVGFLGNTLLSGAGTIQYINGASTASGVLVVSSTASSTKGKIFAGPLTIDEANGFIGINNTAPSSTMLSIVNNAASALGFTIKAAGSQVANLFEIRNSSDVPLIKVSGTGGLQVQSDISSPSGDGLEFKINGGTAYIQAFNRSNVTWKDLSIGGNTLTMQGGGSNAIVISSAAAVSFNNNTTHASDAIVGHNAATGDVNATALYGSSTTNWITFMPSFGTGSSTAGVMGSYFNGSAWKSAWEYTNTTAAAATNILFLKGGGNSGFNLTTTPLNTVDINGTLRVRTITNTSALDSILVQDAGIVKYVDGSTFGATVAGNNRDLQINNNGVFGAAGSDSLEWTAGRLDVGVGTATLSPGLYVGLGTGADYAGEFRTQGDFAGFQVRADKADGNAIPFVQLNNSVNSDTWTWIVKTTGVTSLVEGGALGTDRITISEGGHIGINGTTSSTDLSVFGSNASLVGFRVQSAVTPSVNGDGYGSYISPSFTEQGSGTHVIFASERIGTPVVTGGAATLTRTAFLYLGGSNSGASVTDANYLIYGENASPSTLSGSLGVGTATGIAPAFTLDNYGSTGLGVLADPGGTLTLTSAYTVYVFTGTTATYTLPAVSGNARRTIYIKNRGSGNITLNSNAGGNDIYGSSAVNTLAITPGSAVQLINDNTYWVVL